MPDPVVPPVRTEAEVLAEIQAADDAAAQQEQEAAAAEAARVAGKAKPDASDPAHAEQLDFEEQASRKGWVPKDKFTGPEGKWVDAKTFIERGERFTKNLVREVEQLKDKLNRFEGTRKAFIKFHEETVAKKDKEIAETIRQLKIQRSAATRDGEDEVAVDLEERIDALDTQRKALKAVPEGMEGDPADGAGGEADDQTKTPVAKAKGPNPNDPVLKEWIDDGNEWFQSDESLRVYAVELGEGLIREGVKVRGRPFLDLVAEKMRENFPRRFKAFDAKKTDGGDPPSGRRNNVEGDTGGGGGGRTQLAAVNGKTEKDLPAEDLKLMRQFIAEGWTTREKFLAGYFSR